MRENSDPIWERELPTWEVQVKRPPEHADKHLTETEAEPWRTGQVPSADGQSRRSRCEKEKWPLVDGEAEQGHHGPRPEVSSEGNSRGTPAQTQPVRTQGLGLSVEFKEPTWKSWPGRRLPSPRLAGVAHISRCSPKNCFLEHVSRLPEGL